jgi:hypothetical protein
MILIVSVGTENRFDNPPHEINESRKQSDPNRHGANNQEEKNRCAHGTYSLMGCLPLQEPAS